MFQIIKKLYTKDKKNLIKDLLSHYHTHRNLRLSYIYGALIVNDDLLGSGSTKQNINIKNLYLDLNFLLPDGAALRTMYAIGKLVGRWGGPKMLHNLNGTDFMPYFLDHLHSHNYQVKCITLTVFDEKYGNPKGYLKSAVHSYISNHRPDFIQINKEIPFGDTDYKGYDRSQIEKQIWTKDELYKDPKKINLLLNFRGGGGHGLPHQELFTYYNKNNLNNLGIFCMNQGATVDFRVGKEKRAPQWIRTIRLESVYRLCSDPKKNWKKFLVSFKMIWLIISKVVFGRKNGIEKNTGHTHT